MRITKVVAFFLVATLIWSCKKEKTSPVPSITFIKQSSHEVADSGKGESQGIIFTFDFEDGDADIGPIGTPIPLNNIFFIDSRTGIDSRFSFPPIPTSVVTQDGIKGSFVVNMNPTTLIARDDTTVHKFTDTVRWTVYVMDQKNNISNEVLTDSIVIVK